MLRMHCAIQFCVIIWHILYEFIENNKFYIKHGRSFEKKNRTRFDLCYIERGHLGLTCPAKLLEYDAFAIVPIHPQQSYNARRHITPAQLSFNVDRNWLLQ